MRLGPLLIVLLFLVWGTGSAYWYTCQIKENCPAFFDFLKSKNPNQDAELIKNPGKNLNLFSYWNEPKTELGSEFENLKSSLLSRMGPNDTLKIIGDYFTEESSGYDLGIQRAQNAAKYFDSDLETSRIVVASAKELLDGDKYKNAPFEPVRFTIISGPLENSDVASTTPTDEQKENGYVETFGNKIVVHFPYASVVKLITPEIETALNKKAEELQGTNFRIDVIGHTCNTGSRKTNYWLGRKRAWALKAHLMRKGLAPEKLKTGSRGEKEPIAGNDTEDGRAKNRRVELTITKY